jgi:hypothetical protein
MNGANVVVSAEPSAGESLQKYAEPSGSDVKAAGLDPNTIRIRNPEAVIIQVGVGDEVFATSSIRIEAVGETVEGSDRHMCPLVCVND